MRVCAEAGCPTLTETTRCLEHTKAKRKQEDQRRPNARQRGYTKEHETHRAVFLQCNPYCQEPGCREPATDLDHIDGNPFNRTFDNYRGYCQPHHSQRTARDQPGGWNVWNP